MIKLIIGVIAAVFVVIVGFLVIDPNVNNGTNYDTTIVSEQSTFTITIEGQVTKPGTYPMYEGVTMAEAITKAGGLTSNADTLAFFEDLVLEDKQTYYIAPVYNEDDVCNTNPIEKVNINSDSEEVLTTINGLTKTLATAIIDYRTNTKKFDYLEELMEVYGIGNATYTKLRNFVILHEWFYYYLLFRYF